MNNTRRVYKRTMTICVEAIIRALVFDLVVLWCLLYSRDILVFFLSFLWSLPIFMQLFGAFIFLECAETRLEKLCATNLWLDRLMRKSIYFYKAMVTRTCDLLSFRVVHSTTVTSRAPPK